MTKYNFVLQVIVTDISSDLKFAQCGFCHRYICSKDYVTKKPSSMFECVCVNLSVAVYIIIL